jgi:hypothetical protein
MHLIEVKGSQDPGRYALSWHRSVACGETDACDGVEANDVLKKLRTGQVLGAAVLKP